MSNPINFVAAKRLSENEYRLERARLHATYGSTAIERTGLYEQSLARLFHLSGWTQEQLAQEEGKSRQWIEKRLRLGAFLAFATTVAIPKNLTEWRFRGYWQRTTGENQRQRFQDVARLMESELTLSKDRSKARKRGLVEALLEKFADGEWHRFETMQHTLEAESDDLTAVLFQMHTRGTYHTFCEKRKGGKFGSYRIVRGRGRMVDVDILYHEVSPIVRALEAEGKKHIARWSPGTIAKLAHELKAIIERVTHAQTGPPKAPPEGEKE